MLTDWLLLILPGLIWGASFLFMAEGLRSVGPYGVAFMRIGIGFLTLSLFPSARKPIARADLGSVAALGVLWLAFPLSMFPLAEQRISSALTGMLNAANPLLTTAVAALIARQLPPRGLAIGLAAGMTGTVLMALPALSAGHSSAAGVWIILAALISYAIALNMAQPLQQRYGSVPLLWRIQGVATLLTAPLGIRDLMAAHWTLVPLLSLLTLGIFGTGIAFVLMASAAGRFGASRASGTLFIMPVVALVLGVVILDEHVASLSVAGGFICLMGAWLMKRANAH